MKFLCNFIFKTPNKTFKFNFNKKSNILQVNLTKNVENNTKSSK